MNIAMKFWLSKIGSICILFFGIFISSCFINCRERTREGERKEGQEENEKELGKRIREKLKLTALEAEINQITLYANFVYQRKVKCENCLNV